jgi:chloride channel 3/4/5
VIVTIVGLLTALVAFVIVRAEQVLFDWKEGYCAAGWWKARRFCCPALPDAAKLGYTLLSAKDTPPDELCDTWRTWSEVFGQTAARRGAWIGFEAEMTEYVAYACVAVGLAPLSLSRMRAHPSLAGSGAVLYALDHILDGVDILRHPQGLGRPLDERR